MKIVFEYNSFAQAAEKNGFYDDFTQGGWDFLEEYFDSYMEENENCPCLSDLEYQFYEMQVDEYVDWERFVDDVDCDSVIDWLRDNDYIMGHYSSLEWSNEEGRCVEVEYIMLDRDSHSDMPDYNMMPDEYFEQEMSFQEYLGFDVPEDKREHVASFLEQDNVEGVICADNDSITVDKRNLPALPPFKNIDELMQAVADYEV